MALRVADTVLGGLADTAAAVEATANREILD